MRTTRKLTIEIEKPPSEVFIFTIDPRNLPIWSPQVVEGYWITEPPVQVGSRGVEISQAGDRRHESIFEVTAYQPGYLFSIAFPQHPLQPHIDMHTQMTFDPSPRGTLLSTQTNIVGRGARGVMLALLLRMTSTRVRRHLALLKIALEEGPGSLA